MELTCGLFIRVGRVLSKWNIALSAIRHSHLFSGDVEISSGSVLLLFIDNSDGQGVHDTCMQSYFLIFLLTLVSCSAAGRFFCSSSMATSPSTSFFAPFRLSLPGGGTIRGAVMTPLYVLLACALSNMRLGVELSASLARLAGMPRIVALTLAQNHSALTD